MAATAVPVTTWQGCYGDSWQDLICPEAFAHPAKYSRGLIHRIYRHLLEQGHIQQGATVLDPFGGVALGALDAMTYGLHYVGVELEPRFVELGNKNLELWRQRYGFSGGTLVQGDSRQLRAVLQGAQVQAVVGSPPFLETAGGSAARSVDVALVGRRANTRANGYWGTTPGQLGAMPPGCVVGSPPYAEAISNGRSGIDKTKGVDPRRPESQGVRRLEELAEGYGTTPGQLGAMPPGAVVSSPPWDGGAPALMPERQRETSDSRAHGGPGPQYQTMATLGEPDTFWSAAAQIMQELALLLPAGAVCAWVLKAYVSKKAIVPFPDQWRQLCEAHGFVLVEEIHASLVEDHGTQGNFFGEADHIKVKRASFFRRLAEKKGSPTIDHETVLIVRKASYEETVPGLWEGIDRPQ